MVTEASFHALFDVLEGLADIVKAFAGHPLRSAEEIHVEVELFGYLLSGF